MKVNPFPKRTEIFREFTRGIPYEIIYEKHQINEEGLQRILEENIKGNYDYKRILRGGLEAQKQFLKHLKNRWNPLEPDASWENISPYIENETNSL